MDLNLTDRIAVVTGASRGVGLAVTRALVEEGAQVVAGARDTKSLESLDRVTPVVVDLASPDGPALLVAEAMRARPRRHPRQQRWRGAPPARWVPRHH